ncbi:hypothetical protein B296_00049752 [Ensete ventricosum]|uniref:Uncharacterized protein n=1 Tax=Ensete ventricosum TaxID=4639 RepID=A0A426YPE1_ENSVE|nr:hypothetical protein B296_00049752 [Ensete ventricosum]
MELASSKDSRPTNPKSLNQGTTTLKADDDAFDRSAFPRIPEIGSDTKLFATKFKPETMNDGRRRAAIPPSTSSDRKPRDNEMKSDRLRDMGSRVTCERKERRD